jgi:pSer/pThr/pTyr-binding forkhead associated (FHA) protein
MPTHLVVTAGSLKGTTIPLGQAPILIGRAPESTLVLDDDYASGRHARLSLRHGVWMVEDLGSTNGTFLGRNRVQDPVPIAPGAQVRIGRTVLELRR